MTTTNIYTELVSEWTKGDSEIKIKVAVNGLSFCCEYYSHGEETPSNILRFKAANGLTALDIKRHVMTIENFLFLSGYEGIFCD